MFYYGIRSTFSAPETMSDMVHQSDDAQYKRIMRNVIKSRRQAGRYVIVRWPAGEPWKVSIVKSFTKH